MAIPTSNMEKNVNTPNAVKGQALDLSREAAASVAMAQDFSNTINKALTTSGAALSSVVKAKQDENEMIAANNAFNKYTEEMGKLNALREQWKGADAVKNREFYETSANALHTDFKNAIDSLNNTKIREAFKERVNSYNKQNQVSSFSYFENENKAFLIQTTNAASANEVANAKQKFANGAYSSNLQEANSLFATVDANVESVASLSSGMTLIPDNGNLTPQEKEINNRVLSYLNHAKQQSRQQIVNDLTRYLDETNSDTRPWMSSTTSMRLLKDLAREGSLDANYVSGKMKELQASQLSVELKRNPESYWDANSGRFLFEKVKPHCPNLTQDEIQQAARKVGNGGGSASAGKKVESELSPEIAAFMFDIMVSNGLAEFGGDIAKLAGYDEQDFKDIVESSRSKNGQMKLNTSKVTQMYNLLRTTQNSKVIIDRNSGDIRKPTAGENLDNLPANEYVADLMGSEAIQKAIGGLRKHIRNNIDTKSYDRLLRTKILHNNRPTGDEVASSVIEETLHDATNIGWWQKTKRFILQDKTKLPDIGPKKEADIMAAARLGYEEKMREYGVKNFNELEHDSLLGSYVYRQDDNGNNIGNAVSYEDLAASGIVEGLISELGAQGVYDLFGGSKEAAVKKISQSMRDFSTKMKQIGLREVGNDLAQAQFSGLFGGVGAAGASLFKKTPKYINWGMQTVSRVTTAKDKAQQTNIVDSLKGISESSQDAVRKASAEVLAENGGSVGEAPENFKNAINTLIFPNLPYNEKNAGEILKDAFSGAIYEQLWGNVQYAQTPDRDTYLADNAGNDDSYTEFLNRNIENSRFYSRLQNDGIFKDLKNNLMLYKTSGDVAKAISKRGDDYINGTGIFGTNIRYAYMPDLLDPYGNVNAETKPSEFTAFNIAAPDTGWTHPETQEEQPIQNEFSITDFSGKETTILNGEEDGKQQPKRRKSVNTPKLYFLSSDRQYYFDSDGIPHEYNLPSNEIFAMLMLMRDKSIPPATDGYGFPVYDARTQYVHGGMFSNTLAGNNLDRDLVDIDFTFQ